jgi:UDP-2,3-diacylglucosamine pyrophosphatase LpxH
MNENDIAIYKRLTELYNSTDQNVKELPLNTDTKYALFSDLHLGDGGKSDIFVHNKDTMMFALEYYKKNGYSIILLGDIEELWQFNFIEIHDKYDKSIYELLRSFQANKVHRIFGNHDNDWKRPPTDPILFNENIQHGAPEAIKLGDDIFLVHGHQGDKTCDRKTWESRYWARKGEPLVPIGKIFGISNRSATESQIPGNREKLYYDWAKENNVFLICGHTHNAIFASKLYYWCLKEQIKKKETELKKCSTDKVRSWELYEEIKKHNIDLHIEERMGRHFNQLETTKIPLPCYFNTGCGHFRNGITNIEIEGDKIRLIKWQGDNSLPLEKRREELWKEESLSELRKKLNKKAV